MICRNHTCFIPANVPRKDRQDFPACEPLIVTLAVIHVTMTENNLTAATGTIISHKMTCSGALWPKEEAMIDTNVLWRMIDEKIPFTRIYRKFKPCLHEIVLLELYKNLKVQSMHPAKILAMLDRFERVHVKGLQVKFNEFKSKQSEEVNQFMNRNYNDCLIGFTAMLVNIPIIVTENIKDFVIWERYGIQLVKAQVCFS